MQITLLVIYFVLLQFMKVIDIFIRVNYNTINISSIQQQFLHKVNELIQPKNFGWGYLCAYTC